MIVKLIYGKALPLFSKPAPSFGYHIMDLVDDYLLGLFLRVYPNAKKLIF